MSVSFCDTNVLLYLIGKDAAKAAVAERVLLGRPTISVQVLNEFAHAAKRKSMRSWPEIVDILALVRGAAAEIRPVTVDTHQVGMELFQRYQFALYDAMIVAAALEAGSDTLWSEDMQDGLLVAGQLRIRNPFA